MELVFSCLEDAARHCWRRSLIAGSSHRRHRRGAARRVHRDYVDGRAITHALLVRPLREIDRATLLEPELAPELVERKHGLNRKDCTTTRVRGHGRGAAPSD